LNTVEPEESLFIRKALARAEKAERFQRVKVIVLTTLAFTAAFAFAFRPAGPDLNVECTVLIGAGLIAAVCTAKIKSLMNRNAKDILSAIFELHKK
jgi:hypothetical protein